MVDEISAVGDGLTQVSSLGTLSGFRNVALSGRYIVVGYLLRVLLQGTVKTCSIFRFVYNICKLFVAVTCSIF